MNHEFRIGGVLISSIVPALVTAIVVSVLLSLVLTRVGFYRFVWHRPLVDLAMFVILFGAFVLALPDGWPV